MTLSPTSRLARLRLVRRRSKALTCPPTKVRRPHVLSSAKKLTFCPVRTRTTGPRGRQQTVESRDQTLNNGRKKLAGLCRILDLGDAVLEQSMRFFNLVVSNNHGPSIPFVHRDARADDGNAVQGRQSTYIVASCLFLSCRMAKHPTMLIDISDILQVRPLFLFTARQG